MNSDVLSLGVDEKDSLIYVFEPEESKLHASFLVDGKVLVVENIPGNYPTFSLFTFDSVKTYYDSLDGMDWVHGNMKQEQWDNLRRMVSRSK